jgi:aminoglycoside phosphotransferase (APT) family kinase protein
MNDDLMSEALRRFGIAIDDLAGQDDARSGAGVHPARTHGGLAAYLKLTPARLGTRMLDCARRELRFYRRLADHVPVGTPPFLGALDTDAGVALLVASAGRQVNVEAWSYQAWAALGRDLAGLHAVPVAGLDWSGEDWSGQDSLLEALSEPVSEEVTWFWGDVLPELPELLASRDAMRAELAAQPEAFIHGDCHTGNIVHGPDGLVFCDWQSARLGRATADLAHLSVRATPAGVTIPREMMTAYLDGRGGDAADLERALVLAELAVFVFQWPPYAIYNSQAGIERVHSRAHLLARKWLDTTSRSRA